MVIHNLVYCIIMARKLTLKPLVPTTVWTLWLWQGRLTAQLTHTVPTTNEWSGVHSSDACRIFQNPTQPTHHPPVFSCARPQCWCSSPSAVTAAALTQSYDSRNTLVLKDRHPAKRTRGHRKYDFTIYHDSDKQNVTLVCTFLNRVGGRRWLQHGQCRYVNGDALSTRFLWD